MLAKLKIRVVCPHCKTIMSEYFDDDHNEKIFCSVEDCENYGVTYNSPEIFINLEEKKKIVLIGDKNA